MSGRRPRKVVQVDFAGRDSEVDVGAAAPRVSATSRVLHLCVVWTTRLLTVLVIVGAPDGLVIPTSIGDR